MSTVVWGRRVLWAAGIVTALAVVAGVLVIDSPSHQRLKRLDNARIADLQALDIAARSYWREHDMLPPDIRTLAAQPGMALPLNDPAGGPAYVYRLLDPTHFQLCARFSTDSSSGQRQGHLDAWAHPAGDHCFRREAGDKD